MRDLAKHWLIETPAPYAPSLACGWEEGLLAWHPQPRPSQALPPGNLGPAKCPRILDDQLCLVIRVPCCQTGSFCKNEQGEKALCIPTSQAKVIPSKPQKACCLRSLPGNMSLPFFGRFSIHSGAFNATAKKIHGQQMQIKSEPFFGRMMP